MSVFDPVNMRSLDNHYNKELLPSVRGHFRDVTKSFSDIPGATEVYFKRM